MIKSFTLNPGKIFLFPKENLSIPQEIFSISLENQEGPNFSQEDLSPEEFICSPGDFHAPQEDFFISQDDIIPQGCFSVFPRMLSVSPR